MRGYIFGAKSIAISTYRAVRALHRDFYIEGFLVTSLENNPHEIDGLPVKEVKTAAQRMTEQDKRRVRVWIAVPDDVQSQAKELLRRYGFMDFVPVDACMESRLLEQFMDSEEYSHLSMNSKVARRCREFPFMRLNFAGIKSCRFRLCFRTMFGQSCWDAAGIRQRAWRRAWTSVTMRGSTFPKRIRTIVR